MNVRIANSTRLNLWATKSLNIQDDSEGYYIFMHGRKLRRRTKTELLLVLSMQTDKTIMSLIYQNNNNLQKDDKGAGRIPISIARGLLAKQRANVHRPCNHCDITIRHYFKSL
jgi:hypothetical protein